jgi:hypothetical protein
LFCSVTTAPFTTPPPESSSVPCTVPVVYCANTGAAETTLNQIKRKLRTNLPANGIVISLCELPCSREATCRGAERASIVLFSFSSRFVLNSGKNYERRGHAQQRREDTESAATADDAKTANEIERRRSRETEAPKDITPLLQCTSVDCGANRRGHSGEFATKTKNPPAVQLGGGSLYNLRLAFSLVCQRHPANRHTAAATSTWRGCDGQRKIHGCSL